MESIKILIPINKSPHSNDLMTDQAKNICKSLSSKCDIHIIWAIFPSNVAHHLWDNEEEVRVGKKIEIVKAKDFRNAVDLIKQVNPNIIMVNGSIDFHNVECNLAGKFLKIPTVILFFRNRKTAISISKKSVLKTRMRGLFYRYQSKNGKEVFDWLVPFYFNQYIYFFKTLRATNLGILKSLQNSVKHFQSIIFSYNPISFLLEGKLNFCVNEDWKNELEEAGFDKSTITVAGDPYFEYNYKNTKKNQVLENHKNKIMLCTSALSNHSFCSKNEEMQFIINICNKILEHDENELIIKIHPSTENLYDFEEKVLPKLSKEIKIFQKENMLEIIKQNDIVISYSGSGAIRDGVISGKPVINLKFGIADKWFQDVYVDDKLIIQCDKIEKMQKLIIENKNINFQKEDLEKFIQKYIGYFAGKSSDIYAARILNEIKE